MVYLYGALFSTHHKLNVRRASGNIIYLLNFIFTFLSEDPPPKLQREDSGNARLRLAIDEAKASASTKKKKNHKPDYILLIHHPQVMCPVLLFTLFFLLKTCNM